MKVTRKIQMKMDDLALEVRVGDQINVKLPGQKMTATCHKVTTDGALFVFDNCIARHQMNDTDTNEDGYTGSDLCRWLNEEVAPMFPDKLKRRMRKFKDGNTLRLLTYGEVFGGNCPDWIVDDGQEQLPLMKDRRNRIAFIGDDDWCWWWLQNKCADDASTFANVSDRGHAYGTGASASGGVRPAFLIA